MSPADLVLAVLLLTAAPDSPLGRGLEPLAPALRPALIAAAVGMEIVDPQEVPAAGRFIGDGASPASELQELQARQQELHRAPHVAEGLRFPPKRFIDDWLATNRSYKASLEARLAVDQVHAEVLRRAIAETEELHRIWSLLRDAQYQCYYVTVRRRSLMELRECLGMEAYCRAQMPPHLPIWHFPAWR
jgi:hypothetical protein